MPNDASVVRNCRYILNIHLAAYCFVRRCDNVCRVATATPKHTSRIFGVCVFFSGFGTGYTRCVRDWNKSVPPSIYNTICALQSPPPHLQNTQPAHGNSPSLPPPPSLSQHADLLHSDTTSHHHMYTSHTQTHTFTHTSSAMCAGTKT